MGKFRKYNYTKWFFFLIPIIIILVIYLSHFNYLYTSTSEKGFNSFLENSKLSLIDLKNIFYTRLITSPIDINTIDIPIFKLFVRSHKIDKLNSQLPKPTYFGITHAPKDRVNGYLTYKDKTYFSRVRYRGDNYFHWRLPKKSWRIKFVNKNILDGANQLNFINPKFDSHMNTQLSYYMADKMGLIAPRSYHMALFLNNIYNGVYYYTDQINEAFLRMKNKLPGTVYHGEITDDFYYLFNNSKYWEIKPAKEEGGENKSKEEFDFFLSNVNEKNLDEKGLIKFYKFFNRYLGEDYIKFDALTMLIASDQPDQFHNQKFYLNPSNAKFETIVWDMNTFLDKNLNLPLNYFNNPLILKMHLIPEFVHKKNKFIYDYMNNELSEENLIKIIDEWEKKIEYEMQHDNLKDAKERPHTLTMDGWRKAVENLRNNIKKRYEFLRKSFDDVDVKTYIIGNEIYIDINGESSVKYNNKILHPGRKYNEIDWDDIFNNRLEYVPLRYNLEYINDIKFTNAITNEEVIPKIIHLENINQLPKLDEIDSLHPLNLEEKESKTIIIDKDTTLTKNLFIDKKDKLIIKPGADIKLDKDISIISYGQIIAEGTKENPIIITKNSNAPWGSIVMQDNDKENYFKHCYIDGGSGVEYEHVMYTGQVSVHNSVAYFENCRFSNNEIEDDNFNAKNSYVEIVSCEFSDSPYDAIDFDISEGKIINSKIINSGNDGVDLMTSDILIENNEIDKCGDKGISIGEKSHPKVLNNKITNCEFGLAIKDMSNPFITNNIIESNNVAIAAYHKNWRYEYGGRGKVYNNVLNGNKKDYSIDEFSSEVDVEAGKRKLGDSNITIIEGIY